MKVIHLSKLKLSSIPLNERYVVNVNTKKGELVMKKILGAVIVGLSVQGVMSVAMAADVSAVNSHPSTKAAEYLFVLQADKATISKGDKGYQLTIQSANPKLLYFSDRPVRRAGTVNTLKFMDNWMAPDSTFSKDHPNAAIVFDQTQADAKGNSAAQPVELGDPVKTSTNSWSFPVKDLNGKLSVGVYDKVNIFIDGMWNL